MRSIPSNSRRPAVLFVLACSAALSLAPLSTAQEASPAAGRCKVDLTLPGKMSDILSNALNRGLDQDSARVRSFLDRAAVEAHDGHALLVATAAHFELDEARLESEVQRYLHCNCRHPGGEMAHLSAQGEVVPTTRFASDVVLHVVLHEIGHALVREFDLPVLGNEETLADAFATHYLTTYLPDRAFDVLSARTRSLMIEAGEVPRAEWMTHGEHDSDARRAAKIAALAVAADPAKYRAIAEAVGLSEKDIRSAADYGTEVHRSWRRILAPLWMPAGLDSNEARLDLEGDGGFANSPEALEVVEILREVVRRFDWHSTVKIRFVDGEGTAGWSRSKRTVTVNSEYVQRFVRQGRSAKREERD